MNAVGVGLTAEVIHMALRIGEFYGQHHAKPSSTEAHSFPKTSEEQDDFGEYLVVLSLSKSDLLDMGEGYRAEIEQMDGFDMAYFVHLLSDALREDFDLAIRIMLAEFLKGKV